VKKGQVAHLDHDSRNNSLENLVFLCLEHHDEYDSQTRQSKGLTKREVKDFRDHLDEYLGAGRQNARTLEDRIVTELFEKRFSVNDNEFTYAQIFAGTSVELATGVSLPYFGVLLVDLLGLSDRAIGWGPLAAALGFEASDIFGEFVLLGLWQQLPGSNPKEERYCLTRSGKSVAMLLREGNAATNNGAQQKNQPDKK
jgi:hypothetical protein